VGVGMLQKEVELTTTLGDPPVFALFTCRSSKFHGIPLRRSATIPYLDKRQHPILKPPHSSAACPLLRRSEQFEFMDI
jgi:hypothetical protein